MNRWFTISCLAAFFLLGFALRSPAPLIYTPGEGWVYEPVGGGGDWRRERAKDQLVVAQDAFDKNDYSLAKKAAQRVIKTWPLSDFAPQAGYLLGRCYEKSGQDEAAFKEYQRLIEKYPKVANYGEVIQRQFEICNRFLAGERFKLWNYIPTFPSMDKTVSLYQKVVKNGPYSEVAAQSQMNIGAGARKTNPFS